MSNNRIADLLMRIQHLEMQNRELEGEIAVKDGIIHKQIIRMMELENELNEVKK